MAITAHEDVNLIAVGYKDGTVQLMKGNITRDRASRQVVIHKETEAGVYVTSKLHVHVGNGWVTAVGSSNVCSCRESHVNISFKKLWNLKIK